MYLFNIVEGHWDQGPDRTVKMDIEVLTQSFKELFTFGASGIGSLALRLIFVVYCKIWLARFIHELGSLDDVALCVLHTPFMPFSILVSGHGQLTQS